MSAIKSRIPADTEACIVANPAANCWPASVSNATTTTISNAVSVSDDNTGGKLSLSKKRWAGCKSVASRAAISSGRTSSETCDSSQTDTADKKIIKNGREHV